MKTMRVLPGMIIFSLACLFCAGLCLAGEIHWSVPSGELELAASDQGYSIKMDGYGSLACPGKPELPAQRILLALPPGTRAESAVLIHSQVTTLTPDGVPVPAAPVRLLAPGSFGQEQHGELITEYNGNAAEVYNGTHAYPRQVVELISFGTYRQIPYACIEIHPVQYHPVTRELIAYTDIKFSVTYTESGQSHSVPPANRDTLTHAGEWFENFRELAPLFSSDGNSRNDRDDIYDYVILTSANLVPSIEASDFLTWKQNLGYRLKVVTIEDPVITSQPGRDFAEQIRNFLMENYLLWDTRYLLIVGNTATIPMRYCYPNPADHTNHAGDPSQIGGDVPTDYFYADLSLPESDSWDSDGDGFAGEYGEDDPDFAAELFVGRIPTNLKARITYTLNKLTAFEQDTGGWKNSVLQGGAFWYVSNEDGSGLAAYDGATCMHEMEQDFMTGMTISHYSEQEGLEVSVYDWSALNFDTFTSDWRTGNYGIVNWGAHGFSNRAAQKIWAWDDGDGVPETYNPNEFLWPEFISDSANLDDDYLCYLVAISCLIGCPEPNNWGNIGIDFLTKPGWGPCAAVLGATRVAYGRSGWPENQGGSESTCYEFNRRVIEGPDGPEKAGDALYHAKFYNHTTFPVAHFSENWTQFNYNLYGDPSLVRMGISETPTPRPTATPTPPCTDFATELGMPSHDYGPGDACACWINLCNPDSGSRDNIALYVILDVYGTLFFAPGFGDYDSYEMSLVPGISRVDVLAEFLWPEGAGSAEGLKWYAGMLETGTVNLIGNIDIWEFGFHP